MVKYQRLNGKDPVPKTQFGTRLETGATCQIDMQVMLWISGSSLIPFLRQG